MSAADVRRAGPTHGLGIVGAREHAYATWLVTDGVPINLVQRVMGHEQASTTLNRYTHTPDDYAARALEAFDGSAAAPLPPTAETPFLGGLDWQEDDL
ncbi:tyrosine-type recombinase/integrase [Micromonospora sp. NPDC005173]|uniref:tyrosine-type recombinase/integrase n=1 Tax=Micromonospora sp. NPDC005173 TaxID=3157165 RepID=UPI0033B3468B